MSLTSIDTDDSARYVTDIPAGGQSASSRATMVQAVVALAVLVDSLHIPNMRVYVYIDGFNLYYRRLKRSRHKWVDLWKLSQELLAPDDDILKIRYFTADVSPRAGDPDAPLRQQTYFRALKTIPNFMIHRGQFLPKQITRPRVDNEKEFVTVWTTEEKGSDVNLASHLLMDCFLDRFDMALVISQDSDLLEPIRMVRRDLRKDIVIAWADDSSPGKKYHQAASFIRHIQVPMLARSAFPNPVLGRGGVKIFRPDTWDPERSM